MSSTSDRNRAAKRAHVSGATLAGALDEARLELIEDAAALLDEAMTGLDVSHRACDCCGAKRYANYGDTKLHEKLSGYVESLTNLVRGARSRVERGEP